MSFTDQKPRVATIEDCNRPWGGGKNGEWFRCYLCGHRFTPGDTWRWIFAGAIRGRYVGALCNPIVCDRCDGEDVLERWQEMYAIVNTKFWWFVRD